MSANPDHLSAILWVLLSTLIWTVIFAAGKFADAQIGVFQLTFLRYVGALGTLMAVLLVQGNVRQHVSAQPRLHFIRALTGCGAAVAITWSSAHMPLIDATAIGMCYGVLAVLLGTFVLKERVSAAHTGAIVLSVLGVALIMIAKGAFQSGFDVIPALAAFLSAALFAVEGLLIRILGRAEAALTVMLYVTVFGLFLMLIPAALESSDIDGATLLFCLALGPLGLFAQYCTIRGYRMAPLSVVAPVDYTWLLFAALIGVVFFGEIPTPLSWAGGVAIALGGVLLIYGTASARKA